MKKPFTYCMLRFLLLFFCTGASVMQVSAQTIYNETIRGVDGNSISLSSYKGKKLLFMIVPIYAVDSLTTQVKNFANGMSRVVVIGILSKEDGYQDAQREEVKSMYGGSRIILTCATQTKKGAGQDDFMQWLTDRTKNMHFDKDAVGVGQKFIVNEQGTLVAVLGPALPLNSPVIMHAINTPAVAN